MAEVIRSPFNLPGLSTTPYAAQVEQVENYFMFSVDAKSLSAGSTDTVTITTNRNFDFIWFATTGKVLTSAYANVDPVLLKVQFTISQSNLQDNAVLWDLCVGTAQNPHYLLTPKLIPRSTQIDITFTSFASTNYVIFLALIGSKKYV